MARPKVTGRNEPPRSVRACEFKEDEKKAELARQRKHTKEARARRRIPIDPTIPPWRRGFYTTIDFFWRLMTLEDRRVHLASRRRVSPRLLFQCAKPEGNDQVGGKREQSAHRREVPQSSNISPNDPEHDDA
uniref:Uncharacterized protein n=1 Tax=Solanum tuberosum TaxID=4113 RepID=M1DUB5_SOLTU